MSETLNALRNRPARAARELHFSDVKGLHLHQQLAADPRRGETLAFGKSADQVRAEKTPEALVPRRLFEGNRPSNTILLDKLTPRALGKPIALYEHSVFTQGTVWQIDSFDQWSVELGKALAQKIIPLLASKGASQLAHDSSTNTQIRRYCHAKGLV